MKLLAWSRLILDNLFSKHEKNIYPIINKSTIKKAYY